MGFLDRIKQRAGRLKAETIALYYAARDPRTPWYAKALAVCVVVYAVSPIDLIPDFIPVLGYLDDIILIPLGIALAIKLVPPEVLAECRARADEAHLSGKPVGWIGGAVIIVLWILIITLLVSWGYHKIAGRR